MNERICYNGRMKLKEWLKSNKITQAKISADLGLHHRFFSDMINGRQAVGKGLAKAIEEYTKGQVTRLSLLYPDEY